jgi:O-antigen ligase
MRRLPFYLLWFLIFTIPWQNVVVFPWLGTISRLAGLSAVVVAVLYILAYRRVNEPSLLLIAMVLFVIWSFISYLWSIHPSATFGRFITNIQLLVMAWLIWELCKTPDDRNNLLQAFILGAFISIGDMILTYSRADVSGYRISASGFDPNDLATTMALGIPIAYYLIINRTRSILYIVNMLYIPLAIFCVILTASRGGIVIASITILVIPITFFWLDRFNKTIVASFIMLCIIFISLWLPKNTEKIERNIDRITDTPQLLREGDLNYRQIIWKAGWRLFTENAFLGIGAAGFRHGVSDYIYRGKAPHNTYLSVLVDTGIIGLIIFISLLSLAILPNISLPPPNNIIFIVLFVSLIVALIPLGWEYNKGLWFILSILSLLSAYVIREKKIMRIKKV